MNPRLRLEDMSHLRAFPVVHKILVMERVTARRPVKTVILDGDNDFGRTVVKLRRNGFGLIDLKPEETAFATVWYRKKRALLERPGGDVAMLLWEAHNHGGATTLMTWRI